MFIKNRKALKDQEYSKIRKQSRKRKIVLLYSVLVQKREQNIKYSSTL